MTEKSSSVKEEKKRKFISAAINKRYVDVFLLGSEIQIKEEKNKEKWNVTVVGAALKKTKDSLRKIVDRKI